jgi:diguanylate cyclase (GGDEF)-like protein
MQVAASPSTLARTPGRPTRLRNFIGAIGILAVVATVVGPPVAFLAFGYYSEHQTARTIATRLARGYDLSLATEPDFTWRDFAWIEQVDQTAGPFRHEYGQSLLGPDGELLIGNRVEPALPTISVGVPIMLDDGATGSIRVVTTLLPLLLATGVVGFLATIFGLLVWAVLHRLPLRVLDETIGALDRQTQMLDLALANLPQGVVMYDEDRKLVLCNPRYAEMYELPPHLSLPGASMEAIIDWRIDHGLYHHDPKVHREAARNAIRAGRPTDPVHELPDGRIISISHRPLPGGGGVSTHEDITALHQLQQRLEELAHHDMLTGLANRRYFRERVDGLLADTAGDVALLYIDLARFRQIADLHGHATGDKLLKEVAARLCNLLAPGEIAGRIGARFVVAQRGEDQPAEATRLVALILEALQQPYEFGDSRLSAEPRIGIAVSPVDGLSAEELLDKADLALRNARGDSPTPYQFFASEMDSEAKLQRSLELDLANALGKGELEVHYQPLVNLRHGAIVGCEALLRWNHPTRGEVLPTAFIPVAEASGLIIEIGAFVLRRACTDAAGWPGHMKVAVNLSPVQFQVETLAETVLQILRETGLAASRLELEITETLLLADSEATLNVLAELKAAGIRIAMDDFGTGYSSLSYLQSFPFDKIKIDRSFIRFLDKNNPSSRILMRAVARAGTSLGIVTLAEGIETEEQLDIVRQEGCLEGQGFLFGHPMPNAEISELLRQSGRVDGIAEPGSDGPANQNRGPAASDEESRLAALYELEVLDSPPEEAFDRITRIARAALGAPMAMISLVDRDRQWFKSRQGLDVDETPRHFSFCTHTIGRTEPLIVPDALADPRFRSSPLVTLEPKVRAYAGVPLRTAAGHNIGALCINDTVPREVTQAQIGILQDLAQLVMDELELRRLALTDNVTGAMTAWRFRDHADRSIRQARSTEEPVACFLVDLDHFRELNREHGHAVGDMVLALVARLCAEHLGPKDLIARLSGDDFAILQLGLPFEVAKVRAEELRLAIELGSATAEKRVTASIGVTALRPEDRGIDDLLSRAEAALRRASSRPALATSGGNAIAAA